MSLIIHMGPSHEVARYSYFPFLDVRLFLSLKGFECQKGVINHKGILHHTCNECLKKYLSLFSSGHLALRGPIFIFPIYDPGGYRVPPHIVHGVG